MTNIGGVGLGLVLEGMRLIVVGKRLVTLWARGLGLWIPEGPSIESGCNAKRGAK